MSNGNNPHNNELDPFAIDMTITDNDNVPAVTSRRRVFEPPHLLRRNNNQMQNNNNNVLCLYQVSLGVLTVGPLYQIDRVDRVFIVCLLVQIVIMLHNLSLIVH